MDYHQFFLELRDCYASHGLEFGHDFESSVIKSWTHIPNKWMQPPFHNNMSKPPFCYSDKPPSPGNWAALRDKYAGASSSTKASLYALRPRVFFSAADMVYTLAWDLSREIGRLPDALHARMVLSTDDHRARRTYIESHGV